MLLYKIVVLRSLFRKLLYTEAFHDSSKNLGQNLL